MTVFSKLIQSLLWTLNIPKEYEGSKLVEVFNNGEIYNLIKSVKLDSSAEEEIFGVEPGNKKFLS